MTFELLCTELALHPAHFMVWRQGWDESQAGFSEANVHFLSPAFVDGACRRIGLSCEVRNAILAALPSTAALPALRRLAWHLYRRLYERPGLLSEDVRAWPLLPPGTFEGSDMFLAYLFLAGVPRLARIYRKRGIPAAVLRDTLSDLELWIREHRRNTGRWGFSEHKWLIHHLAANLFRLGRLQFQFGTFRYPYVAFRQTGSNPILLLAEAGLHISATGLPDPTQEGFPSTLEFDARSVTGFPVDPAGTIRRRTTTLPLDVWHIGLTRGDPVLNIHIPAGQPMAFEACGESFRRAVEFFPRHFPERPFRAFVCGSWALDPQLAEYLDESSNLVRFMREVYLFPLPGSGGDQIERRVLGAPLGQLDHVPAETSLQRAVVAHLRNGRKWRSGGCILFPEDLAWGKSVYGSAAGFQTDGT